jgi:hypothetical protein
MDQGLTDEERARLRALGREVPPPPELEERIARTLVVEGLLVRRPRKLVLAAAAAALFAVGLTVGLVARGRPGAAVAATGPRYVMLLESPADDKVTAAGEEARVAAIIDWARRQRAAGTALEGEKLADGGYAVSSSGVSAAPSTLGGYFVLHARDDADALRIAASHPLVGWGGRVVLRRIEEL